MSLHLKTKATLGFLTLQTKATLGKDLETVVPTKLVPLLLVQTKHPQMFVSLQSGRGRKHRPQVLGGASHGQRDRQVDAAQGLQNVVSHRHAQLSLRQAELRSGELMVPLMSDNKTLFLPSFFFSIERKPERVVWNNAFSSISAVSEQDCEFENVFFFSLV